MINRRDFLGLTAGASAALAFPPDFLRALQQKPAGRMIQRAIPSSGEMLPVISYAPRVTDGAAIKQILKTFADNGGKVVDVLHGGPAGEEAARTAANELGIQNKYFWTTPLSVAIPVLPGYSGPPLKPKADDIKAVMEEKFAQFKTPKIDLVMVGAGGDLSTYFDVLRAMKKDGRVRYIGVHTLLPPANMQSNGPGAQMISSFESIIRDEQIDFVACDYSAGDRRVEEKILPLAVERKIAFMAYFPFDRGRLFKRVGTTPLPEWAAEFDAKTWAQFFLKYVLSHPGVVVAREGTTNAAHMLDNIAGGVGRLPNEAMRKRMADFVDALPPTPPAAPPQPQPTAPKVPPIAVTAETLDRYVGDYTYAVTGQIVTFRRDGDKLMMKITNMPEVPIAPLTETRFAGPLEMVFEFKVDGQGKVMRAVVEQGPYKLPLERK